MLLKPPKFWYQQAPANAIAFILKPLATLYNFETQRRLKHIAPIRSVLPVICIGNITLGGVGKTPFALTLADLLQNIGFSPNFLTRGYGGGERGPIRVDPARHTARQTGDEALLLARKSPTWVAGDRVAGARAINASQHHEAQPVIVMDDGFQNPRLHKDISIVLIDATNAFGNGLVFPAGPLRERPVIAKRRADILVFVKPGPQHTLPDPLVEFAGDTPWFECWQESMPTDRLKDLAGKKRFFAFCGIGSPDRFFASCTAAGFNLIEKISFPDHYRYRDWQMDRLIAKARAERAVLITTRKDFMRLKTKYQKIIHTLDIETKIADPDRLITAIRVLIPARDPVTKTESP